MKLWDILIGALAFVDLHEDKQVLYKPYILYFTEL